MAAEHHGDDIAAVAVHRGDEIEARGSGISRFDAVDAADHAQQVVVIAHRHAVVDELFRGEVSVIVREALLDGAPEQGLVARGTDLIIVGQAGCVHVGGAAHPQCVGLLRHELGERVFVTAKILGNRDGSIVRRLRNHRLDGILDRDGLAGFQPEFCRCLLGRVLGNLERRIEPDLAGVEPLE